MLSALPIKKFFRTALYTSPLIGTLAITPLSAARSWNILTFLNAALVFTVFIFCVWSLNIGVTYYTEKHLFGKFKKHKRYLISYVICIMLVLFLPAILKSFLPPPEPHRFFMHRNPEHFHRSRLLAFNMLGICINTVILIIQDLILLREKQAIIELENAQLKIKNIEATNQQLKQQIHPHFLFNSLNTLKMLIKRKPEMAEEYLIKLSDFLRGSIASGNYNIIKIEEELKLCLDYLEMQKIRFNDALQYTIDIPDEVKQELFVPSFSLQLLCENAIKHNILTNESPLRIHIKYEMERIIVSNNFQKKSSGEKSTNIGLVNLAERYRIISSDELIIHSTEQFFSVSIKALHDENSNNRG